MRFFTMAFCFISLPLIAQNNRSFVATFGNDANNCTAGSECRSFTRALAVTNAGGEVIAINSGGFGPFFVTKAVTVAAAPGVRASITSSSSDAIDVIATINDDVILDGLTIFASPVHSGISGSAYRTLSIEHCSISGGNFDVVIQGAGGSFATISDTVARNAGGYGVAVLSHAAIIRSRIEGCNNAGLYVQDGSSDDGKVSTVDLVSVRNAYGVFVTCTAANHSVTANLDRAMLSENVNDGLNVDAAVGSAIGRISNSSVTDNGNYGLVQIDVASAIESLGNNFLSGNFTSNEGGSVTILGGH